MRPAAVQEYLQNVARMGGHARAAKLTKKELSEAARKASRARWAKMDKTLTELERKNKKQRAKKKAVK